MNPTHTLHGLYFFILHCRVKDHIRRSYRNKIDLMEDLPEPTKTAVNQAELRDDQRHELALFRRVLTEREFQVVVLKFRQGLTTSQIARQLAIPEGTVCSDLSIVRRKLRDHLGEA